MQRQNNLGDSKSSNIPKTTLRMIDGAIGDLCRSARGFLELSLARPLQNVSAAWTDVSKNAPHESLSPLLSSTIIRIETYIKAVLTQSFDEQEKVDELEQKVTQRGGLEELIQAISRLTQNQEEPALSNTQKKALIRLKNALCGLFEAVKSFELLLDKLGEKIGKMKEQDTWEPKTIAAARKLHSEMYSAHRSDKLTVQEKAFLLNTVCCVGQFLENPTDTDVQGNLKQLALNVPAVKYPNLRRVVGALLFFAGIALSIFIPPAFGGGLALVVGGGALFVSASNKMPVDALRQFEGEAKKEATQRELKIQ